MSKRIDRRLCTEYPGMVRTIIVFDDNTVDIEYNYQYSNEIGHRFKKCYDTYKELENEMRFFIKNSGKLELGDDELLRLGERSNLILLKDIIDNKFPLPSGFEPYDGIDDAKRSYQFLIDYYKNHPDEDPTKE